MKDWIFISLLVFVMLAAIAVLHGACDPAEEDDPIPVEPIEDED